MMRHLVASLSAVGLALSLTPTAMATPDASRTGLDWQPCGVEQFCAWVSVPINHGEPHLGTLALRIIRIPARSPQPQASLVINPGGPGAPAIDFTRTFVQNLPNEIRNAFDIIAFDTRGTGDSSPLRCVTNSVLAKYLRTDSTPVTNRQQRTWMRESAQWSRGCRQDQPLLAAHMETTQIVRDLDAVREALGEPKLNFLGFSYGTLLGARYAQLFPDRVGRFVLDGAVDPRLDAMEISRDQAAGFQLALKRFAAQCTRTPACTLGRSTGSIFNSINRILQAVEHKPMRTTSRRTLTESEALTALVTAMYAPTLWPTLWRALDAASRGNGTELQRLADLGNGRYGPDNFSGNFLGPFLATTCLDLPRPPRQTGLAAAATRWSKGANIPRVSALLAWSNAPCATWFKTGERPGPVSSTTSAPMLVIGTTFDPATPYRWSRALHQQLASSTLVTLDADGHTAFQSGSACIDSAVTTYLLTGIAPTTVTCAIG
jgi:pimeloyl-ACP methyl ester carboxylesterase